MPINPAITEEDNIVNFPRLAKAIDPPDSDDPEWVRKLTDKTTFLVQTKKDMTPVLLMFHLFQKLDRAVFLIPENKDKPVAFDPIRFCRDFRLYEIVQSGEDYQLQIKANEQIRKDREEELPPWEGPSEFDKED